MKQPLFTILLPIHRPPAFLPLSVDTILGQSLGEFELFIICDGAPSETAGWAQNFAATDPRVTVFVHPKGERHGEVWRHAALQHAHGRYVAHINDDDLWFPNHLEELTVLLDQADFGNLPLVNVDGSGQPSWWFGDLKDAKTRHRVLTSRFNFANLTVTGYRLDAYRKLPVGWSPAPPDVWSDHFMWRKFLAVPDLVVATRFAITALHFPDPETGDETLEEKRDFIGSWKLKITDAKERDAIVQETIRELLSSHATEIAHLESRINDWIFESKCWKITAPFRWMTKSLSSK